MSKDNNHNVYINAEGHEVLRVSQVIRCLAKEQIALWANMLGWKRIGYREELDRTARIGTFAHAMIESYYSDHELCFYDFEQYGVYGFSNQQEAYNAAESFFKWLRINERLYKVIDTEVTIVGKQLGGTIDCIVEHPYQDGIILVDYKTSSRIQFTHFLQLAGYVMIYEELHDDTPVRGVAVMRLDKKYGNKAEAKFIRRGKLQPYIECFKSLLTVAILSKELEQEMKFDIKSFTVKCFGLDERQD